jgi:anaerobic magnesium-protoporphyrin IX monomethyl ester cyclase
MKLLLINPTLTGEPEAFHVGLATVGSYVAANSDHDARVLDFAFQRSAWRERLAQELDAYEPDLVGIYISTPYFPSARKVAREVKTLRPGLPVLGGGHHATLSPDAVIGEDAIDMLIIGEGEVPTLALLDALAAGDGLDGVPSLWWKDGAEIRKADKAPLLQANRIPVLNWDLYNPDSLRDSFYIFGQLPMMGSRGCPYRCSFCAITNVQKLYKGEQFLRFRDPVEVVDEVAQQYERYHHLGMRIVYFWDLNFLMRVDWLRAFTEEYRRRGLHRKLPWSAFTRADHVTEEAMACLVDSGCVALRVGIESGNEYERNAIYEKDLPQERLYDAMRMIKAAGIATTGYFLVGGPGERPEWLLDSLEFAYDFGVEFPVFFLYKPLSGTDVVERAAEMGSKIDPLALEEAADFVHGVQMTHEHVSKRSLIAFMYLTQFMGGTRLLANQLRTERLSYVPNLLRYAKVARRLGFSPYETIIYYTLYGRDHLVDPLRLPIRESRGPIAKLAFSALRRVWRSKDGGPKDLAAPASPPRKKRRAEEGAGSTPTVADTPTTAAA